MSVAACRETGIPRCESNKIMDGDQGTGSGKRSMVSLIVGVALGVVIGLLVVWGLFCIYNRFFGEKAGTFVYTPF